MNYWYFPDSLQFDRIRLELRDRLALPLGSFAQRAGQHKGSCSLLSVIEKVFSSMIALTFHDIEEHLHMFRWCTNFD